MEVVRFISVYCLLKCYELYSINKVFSYNCFTFFTECVESLDWSSDCTAVTGQPLGCLKWKKCNYLAADTKCIASCEALKIPTSISAHYERDEIRASINFYNTQRHSFRSTLTIPQFYVRCFFQNLAEDINTTKNRIDAINVLLKKLFKLKQRSLSKFEDFHNRLL